MWDQHIRTKAEGVLEKKVKPLFSTGDRKKREVGKSLWSNEGRKYFRDMAGKWKKIYDSKDAMIVLYNRWDDWIKMQGKEIQVGDGSKTFHYVMGTWYDDDDDDETGGLKDTNDEIDEDEDKDGYGSDGNHSKHRRAWLRGELVMGDNTQREEKKVNIDHNSSNDNDSSGKGHKKLLFDPSDGDDDGIDSDDDGSGDTTAAGISGGSLAGNNSKRGVKGTTTAKRVQKETTATEISGGSPAGNNSKRGWKRTVAAAAAAAAADISGGSPADNTRGEWDRK